MTARTLAAFVGSALLAGHVLADDYVFQLIDVEDVDLLCSDNTSNFYVGNNPSCIAWDGLSLYIGGFANGTAPSVSITQLIDPLGTRSFLPVPNARIMTSPNGPMVQSRGYSGLDWDDVAGLVGTADLGSAATPGQVRRWVPDASPPGLDFANQSALLRGIAGPSFDWGYNGGGFDLDGDGSADGPAVAVVDFSAGGSSSQGPFGLNPLNLDVFQALYSPDTGGPITADADLSGTIYRDIDVDPNTGNLATRSANDVSVVIRASDGSTADRTIIDGGSAPFIVGQNVAMIHGLGCDREIVIWNFRDNTYSGGPLPSGSVAGASRGNKLDGTPVNLIFENADGSPAVFPDSIAYLDYAWDEANQLLFVLDFANRDVYFLELTGLPGGGADWNNDGSLDFFDVQGFLNAFSAHDPAADINNDGSWDFFDVQAFLNLFSSGGC